MKLVEGFSGTDFFVCRVLPGMAMSRRNFLEGRSERHCDAWLRSDVELSAVFNEPVKSSGFPTVAARHEAASLDQNGIERSNRFRGLFSQAGRMERNIMKALRGATKWLMVSIDTLTVNAHK